MYRTLIKERAEALLDMMPSLERALDGAAALDRDLTAEMNGFSEAFRAFCALEKHVGPPVRETGTEMAVQEVIRRLERTERVWEALAQQELSARCDPGRTALERIGCGCVDGRRLAELTLADWLAPALLSVFQNANGGRVGCYDFFGPHCGVDRALSVLRRRFSAEAAAVPGDPYYAFNLTLQKRGAADLPVVRHILVIDRFNTLREGLKEILHEEILPSEYEFVLTFTAEGEEAPHRVYLESISTGTPEDPLGLHNQKGLTSATFRRFVEIMAGFYPGVISTCAVSPITEHWFKKYFNAVLFNAERENVYRGVIPAPDSLGMIPSLNHSKPAESRFKYHFR